MSAKFAMCCPCVTPDTYNLIFNINAIYILQALRDIEQNENKMAGYPYETLHFVYIHGPAIFQLC